MNFILWLHNWYLTHWMGDWVGPTSELDVLGKRKILYSCLESCPGSSCLRPSHYADWAILSPESNLTFLNLCCGSIFYVYSFVSWSCAAVCTESVQLIWKCLFFRYGYCEMNHRWLFKVKCDSLVTDIHGIWFAM